MQLGDNGMLTGIMEKVRKSPRWSLFVAVALLTGVCNVLAAGVLWLSYVILACQIGVLLFCFLKKDICDYYLYFITFVALSLEMEAVQTEKVLNIVLFEVFDVSLSAVLMLPLLLMAFWRIEHVLCCLKKHKITAGVFVFFCAQFAIALVMGAVLLLGNDNNVRGLMPGAWRLFASHVFAYVIPLALMFITIAVVADKPENKERIKQAIFVILGAAGISMLASWGAGVRGQYDEYDYLLASLCVFYLPCLVAMALRLENKKQRKIFTISAVLLAVFACIVAPSGKSLLVFCTIPVMLLLQSRSKKKILRWGLFLIPVAVILAIAVVKISKMYPDNIVSDKIQQVVGLLDITNPDYLAQMPLSPRCRVVELIDILCEYVEKPWLALFGKGFLGTFPDKAGLMIKIDYAFTEVQWEAELFYLPHETFSRLWLMSGFFGAAGFLVITVVLLKNLNRTPMILGGLFWFLFFHGYSISLAVLGVAFFILGLLDTDEGKQREAAEAKEYDVLFLDFFLIDGHKYFCNHLVDAVISAGASCFAVTKEEYLTFDEDARHQRVCYKPEGVIGKNPIVSRLNFVINMYRSLSLCKGIRAKKIILLGYEPLTFRLICHRLCRMGEVILVQHHQLDEIYASKVKKFVFDLYKNKTEHVVADAAILESTVADFAIQSKCYAFPIPSLTVRDDTAPTTGDYVLAISNSNEESFLDELEAMDKSTDIVGKTGFRFVVRTTKERPSTNAIRYIQHRLTDEEYLHLYANAGVIWMPFPSSYRNRCSGTLVDAISMKKCVLCTKIPFTEYYASRYPSLCKVYSTVQEFIEVLCAADGTIDLNEFRDFCVHHDKTYLTECAKEIIQ